MNWLRRHLPDWAKPPLRRVRAAWRRVFPARATTQRLERTQESLERARTTVRAAQQQRDEARALLRDARSELRSLRQTVARHGIEKVDDDESAPWWDRRLDLGSGPRGVPLAHYPSGASNPYMELLYSRVREYGFDPVPVSQPEVAFRLPSEAVVHVHWTRAAQLGATSEEDARIITESFLEPFADHVDRGGRLIWSIHEPLPHDCPYPGVEIDLRRRLASLATGVHVLHASTVDEVAPLYEVDPGKVIVVEHPLYTGVYPDYVTRAAARAALGIDPDAVVLLGFGAIRPYKGFDRIIDALPVLREESGEDLRFVVAGPTAQSEDMSDLLRAADESPWTSIHPTMVPDRYVQVLFRAADVMVLPYRYIHNSGAMMLGLTFGVRCVAADNLITRDATTSGLVHPFDATSDDDLRRAVLEAIASRGSAPDPGSDFLARHAPGAIGERFARRLSELVG